VNDGYQGYFERHTGRSITFGDIESKVKWFYTLARLIERRIPFTADMRILEIGSGHGGFYGNLGYRGDYTGLELDGSVASLTGEFFKTDDFKTVSFEEFDPEGLFDLVVAFEVLEHLEDPIESIIKIHDILQPAGTFCGTTPYPYRKNIVADDTHKYVLHPESWKRLFEMGGFKKIELRPVSYAPLLWRLDRRLNPLLPFYVPLPYFLSTCLIIAKP
jgi:SAM-dependent methyltransferase